MEALGLNLGFFLVQLFNFLIMALILRAWAYEPIVKLIKARQQKIAQSLEDARVAAEARENAETTAQKIIAEAHVQANQRLAAAVAAAEQAAAEIRARAEAESERLHNAAQDAARAERDRILGELRGQIAALAIAAAQKIIGETLDAARQQALIDNFFSGLKAGRVEVLEAVDSLVANSAEVTSAVPLSAAEQDMVRAFLTARLTPPAEVTFKVDPAILGGLVIRAGDRLFDGSVAAHLQNLFVSLT